MALDRSNYVSKEKVQVKIETTREIITGTVHVLYRHRASDLLNDEARFIPVTEATIKSSTGGGEAFHAPFLALNKDYIMALFESKEGE